jgi:DNA repair protein RecO (recombination protein O)
VSSRNLVYDVLLLRTKEVPSGSRVLTLLSAEVGLLDVFVFGGPKSKLRSLASPWGAGKAYIYHDPVKDYYKLSDFEVREPFSGLREGLRKIMAANLVVELLQKTSGGGGDFPEVLELATACLRGIETLPEERADYPLLLFIWRLVGIIGLLPDPGSCVHCGRDMAADEPRIWFQNEGGFACPRCGGSRDDEYGPPRLSAGALRWLERAAQRPFAEALTASLDGPSLAGLRRLAFGLARSAAEAPLEVLEAAAGIL